MNLAGIGRNLGALAESAYTKLIRGGRVFSLRIAELGRRPVPYTWTAATIQIVMATAITHGLTSVPWRPNVAMGILAVAGVFMAVRAEHFTETERIGWVLIACSLFWVEVRAVNAERDQQVHEQVQLRKEEDQRFAKVLADNHSQFEATMQRSNVAIALSKETIDQITGGDTYPSVLAGRNLAILAVGKYDLKDVYIEVTAHTQTATTATDLPAWFRENVTAVDIRTIHTGVFNETPIAIKPQGERDEFHIKIMANNGSWNVILVMRPKGEGWTQAQQVSNMRGKILLDSLKGQ